MIEDLKRIIAVVQEGSVTKAAEKLYITQPALSQAIKRVEKQLGIQLFKAEGKKLHLTKYGEASLLVMERIMLLWDTLLHKKDLLGKEPCTIGMYDNAALLLADVCDRYYSDKTLSLEVIIDASEKLYSQLLAGIVDICICIFDPQKKLPKNIKLVMLYEEELIAVSSKKWKTSLEQISFILYNHNSLTRTYIDKTFMKFCVQPTVIAESTSPDFMKELALIGSGVALLPKNVVKDELKNKKLYQVSLPLQFSRTVAMYYNTTNPAKEAQQLVGKLREKMENRTKEK